MRKRQAMALGTWVLVHPVLSVAALLASFALVSWLAAIGSLVLLVPLAVVAVVAACVVFLAALHRRFDRWTQGHVNTPRLQGFRDWQVQGRLTAQDLEDIERRFAQANSGRRPGDLAVTFAGVLLLCAAASVILGVAMFPLQGYEQFTVLVASWALAVYLGIVGLPLLRDGLDLQRAEAGALEAAEKALIAKAAGTAPKEPMIAAPGGDVRRPTLTRVR